MRRSPAEWMISGAPYLAALLLVPVVGLGLLVFATLFFLPVGGVILGISIACLWGLRSAQWQGGRVSGLTIGLLAAILTVVALAALGAMAWWGWRWWDVPNNTAVAVAIALWWLGLAGCTLTIFVERHRCIGLVNADRHQQR